jgi:hypothetical protein
MVVVKRRGSGVSANGQVLNLFEQRILHQRIRDGRRAQEEGPALRIRRRDTTRGVYRSLQPTRWVRLPGHDCPGDCPQPNSN